MSTRTYERWLKGLRIGVIGFLEYSSISQRGICVTATALAELGHEVTFITFPTYLWHVKSRKALLNNTAVPLLGDIVVLNRTRVTYLPYSKRIPRVVKRVLRKWFERSHANTLLKEKLDEYDLIVIESGKAVMAAEYINCDKIIYRQSDPVEFGLDSFLGEYERRLIEMSSLTLIVNNQILDYYHSEFPHLSTKMRLWENGFVKPKTNSRSPYKNNRKNAVYFGLFPVDWEYIEALGKAIPELDIHIIGPHKRRKVTGSNVILYGSMSHDHLIPYVEHSDLCLLTYRNDEEHLRFVDKTSKLITYMYFRKPVLATPFFGSERLEKYGVTRSAGVADFVSKAKLLIDSKEANHEFDFEKYSIEGRKRELIHILKENNLIE